MAPLRIASRARAGPSPPSAAPSSGIYNSAIWLRSAMRTHSAAAASTHFVSATPFEDSMSYTTASSRSGDLQVMITEPGGQRNCRAPGSPRCCRSRPVCSQFLSAARRRKVSCSTTRAARGPGTTFAGNILICKRATQSRLCHPFGPTKLFTTPGQAKRPVPRRHVSPVPRHRFSHVPMIPCLPGKPTWIRSRKPKCAASGAPVTTTQDRTKQVTGTCVADAKRSNITLLKVHSRRYGHTIGWKKR